VSVKIAIFGGGPGGYIAAVRAAQLGAEVTVIEEDNLGGTCLNWGCIPSKVLITAANLLGRIRNAEVFGITINGDVLADMTRLMERKDRVVEDQRKGILDLLKRHKIQYLKGTGYLKKKGLAGVRLSEGGEQEVFWDRLILATGSKPFNLPGLPFDGEKILSSNDALCLQEVPESMLIVGGGVIGCEFGFLFSALGTKVTIVEALSRILPLPSVDEDCSRVLQREMKKRKIEFMVNRVVEGFSEEDGKLRVTIGPSPFLEKPTERDNKPVHRTVEKVLVSVGRSPNSTNIQGLESVNVQLDHKGWVVSDELMQTTEPDVYAIGDLLGPGKIMLAHVASAEGLVAAENAMGGKAGMDYRAVPGVIFTSPEIADVGLTEAQAKEQGYQVRSDTVLFRTLGKAHVIGEIAGQAKIVSEKDGGKILGIHIIGPHATDLIGEATLALRTGCNVKDLAETIHAHPTLSEVIGEAAFLAMDLPLHG